MRSSRLSNERGMALALAIFALVVVGALVAGTFFAGRLEQQMGQSTIYVTQAAEAAQAGLEYTIGSAMGADFDAIATGTTATWTTPPSLGNSTSATAEVQRLTDNLFLVRSLGKRLDANGNELARDSVGALVRLVTANVTVNAGLKAMGDVMVGGNSTVSGIDATPSAWTSPPAVDCPTPANVTGVIYNGTLNQSGSSQIQGQPPVTADSNMTAGNMIGGSSFDQLKALRTLTLTGDVSGLAPVVTGTPARCDTSVESNWGDPVTKTSPCFSYFPIIYHYGNLGISGTGAGQGILLVEGDLNVQGRIDFYGPVIVTGSVNVRGTGSDDVKFYGGIIAQDVTLDDSRLTGNATVNYSSCAIKRALKGSADLKGLNERSWVQLYSQ